MTGVYYSFDIPAALHQQLKDYMTDPNSPQSTSYAVKFNLLYSVYSIPNIILPFFGGTIVDQLGAHNCTLVFAGLTLFGQILFAIGATHKSWNMMLLGRTVYGFGGENISVATSTLTSKWFQGKELALSFGINLAVSRMGSVVNNLISPKLANQKGTPMAIWFGVLMNSISVVCAVVICVLTKRGERERERDRQLVPLAADSLTDPLLENDEARNEDSRNRTCTRSLDSDEERDIIHNDEHDDNQDRDEQECRPDSEDVHISANDQLDDLDFIQSDVSTVVATNVNVNESVSSSFTCLHHVRKFSTMFWLLSASCIVVYGCVLPFNNIASGILLERNYFTKPSSGCELKYPDQCTSGSLAPSDGNPALDSSGNVCSTKEHSQPLLPTSIHINVDDGEKEKIRNYHWDNDSYDFDSLSENDVDCGDAFWKDDCTKEFCDAQGRATEISGRIMSIPYILSATLSPFCGHIVDKIGLRAIIASMASLILICVHLSLALTDISPVLPLIGQGLAYTCYAAVIWPSVPLTVVEDSIGTAFGAITAIQNFGLALFPLIIAGIYTTSGETYIPNVEYFFVACAVAGTGVGVMLNMHDARNGGILNKRYHED